MRNLWRELEALVGRLRCAVRGYHLWHEEPPDRYSRAYSYECLTCGEVPPSWA